MTAHAAHFHAGTPREARTVATAIPSGMLWTPMASVTSWPWAHPRLPLNETPRRSPAEGVRSHDAHHQEGLARVRAAECGEFDILLAVERALEEGDEGCAGARAEDDQDGAVGLALVHEIERGGEHDPARQGVGQRGDAGESRPTKRKGTAPRPLMAAMMSVRKNTAPTVTPPSTGAVASSDDAATGIATAIAEAACRISAR